MALLLYSRFRNNIMFHCFYAQPQWVMLVALWGTGFLFSFFTFCASLDEECVLGIVGRPILLPCFHHEALSFVNLSVEWRRDAELVLKAKWEEDGSVDIWSLNSATIRADAPQTRNFSLELPKVTAKDNKMLYRLFFTQSENGSAELCSMCLRTAARFSSPLLLKNHAGDGNETVFTCQSSGGFPEPTVYWLINDTEQPPEGSVWTSTAALPDSNLYNVTSLLTVNISRDDIVSCSVENEWMNETLTSKSSGTKDNTIRRRASEGMWMFSTGLCVAVGILVAAGVGYQIHLDRISKKRRVLYESTRTQRGYKKKPELMEDTEVEILTSKETTV